MAEGFPPPPIPPPIPPPVPPAGSAASPNRNVMILLSYLWLLALIPLVIEKEDKEVQWHAKHGLVLMIGELIFWVAFNILTVALGTFLGCLAAMFGPIVGIGFLIVHIMAIVKGINGSRLIIPGVSQYADKF